MATPSYVPVRGEIVWIYSRSGKGTYLPSGRPAVTVSPEAYNRRAGLALFCPITDEEKGYPFEVAIPGGFRQPGSSWPTSWKAWTGGPARWCGSVHCPPRPWMTSCERPRHCWMKKTGLDGLPLYRHY